MLGRTESLPSLSKGEYSVDDGPQVTFDMSSNDAVVLQASDLDLNKEHTLSVNLNVKENDFKLTGFYVQSIASSQSSATSASTSTAPASSTTSGTSHSNGAHADTPSSNSTPHSTHFSTGAIAGVVIGVLAAIAFAAFLVFRRHRRRRQARPAELDPQDGLDGTPYPNHALFDPAVLYSALPVSDPGPAMTLRPDYTSVSTAQGSLSYKGTSAASRDSSAVTSTAGGSSSSYNANVIAMKEDQSRFVRRVANAEDASLEAEGGPFRIRVHEDSGVRISGTEERVLELPPVYVEA